jgi:hypothetical protein
MSPTAVTYFMYQHHQHCSIRAGPPIAPKSPDSFTLFPLLPPEIRLKIWETIGSEPNIVELSRTPTAAPIPESRWFSHSKPPILFTICSESREAALKTYSTLDFPPEQKGIPWPKLYINFAVDTLWLCSDLHVLWARDLLEQSDRLKSKLRSLAIDETVWKALNPVIFTPGFAMTLPGISFAGGCPEGVRGGLKALEDLKFHS